jgi:dTDP-4-amino-4,6-dideoxygalactose transaminase
VKIITSVDGGCVVVRSQQELQKLHHLRLLGVDKDTTERYKNSRAWEYDVVDQGFRYHLTNIMASVGVSQIKRVDEFIASRQSVCTRYSEAFSSLDGVVVLRTAYDDVSPFIYAMRVLHGRRSALIEHLRERGIAAGIHFLPAHHHTYFANCRRGDMTVTDQVGTEIITLPLHSNMAQASIQRVIEGVCSFFD